MKVFITGASSGIGAATAAAFAASGHTVGICARRRDRLEDVAKACGPRARSWVADLSDLTALDDLAATVDDELGGVDVLVNNAGVPKRRRARALKAADIESVMTMNYFSPARLTLAFLPRMLEHGHGEIVNVSSMGGPFGSRCRCLLRLQSSARAVHRVPLYLELANTGVHARLVRLPRERSKSAGPLPLVAGAASHANAER
jgi:NADP-dependent 3-hydroxy acid dehydrogenase YdfG